MLAGTLPGLRGSFRLRLASTCNHRPAPCNRILLYSISAQIAREILPPVYFFCGKAPDCPRGGEGRESAEKACGKSGKAVGCAWKTVGLLPKSVVFCIEKRAQLNYNVYTIDKRWGKVCGSCSSQKKTELVPVVFQPQLRFVPAADSRSGVCADLQNPAHAGHFDRLCGLQHVRGLQSDQGDTQLRVRRLEELRAGVPQGGVSAGAEEHFHDQLHEDRVRVPAAHPGGDGDSRRSCRARAS